MYAQICTWMWHNAQVPVFVMTYMHMLPWHCMEEIANAHM